MSYGKLNSCVICENGEVSVSDYIFPAMVATVSCGHVLIKFSTRKQIEDLSRALLLLADTCFPIGSVPRNELEAMVIEGGLHEKKGALEA